MAQYDGSIRINTNINTDGLRRGEKNVLGSMNRISSAAKRLASVIGAAFAVRKIVQFGKEAIELGSDLQEVQNVVDVTFTTMSKKVNEFAKNAAISAGLSETMAKKYVGTFGAMSKSFGFTEDEAYKMSTALTQLSGDVASFYNITQDEAFIKLKSVFTGETETLKDLGVVMTQAALDQYALANGFGKTTSKMTEQEKVALRYRFVLQQLSGASGDFIRTADGWANQVRILKLQFDSLKATIGQGLINIFTPVIKIINILLAKLATVANAFRAFTELITGKKSQAGGSAGISKKDGSAIGAGYDEAAEGAENLASANEDAAKSAGKAAKAAKSQLSTLDKLNNLYSQSSGSGSGGSGGSGGGGIGGAIEDIDYGKLAEGETQFEKLSGILDSIILKIKELAGLFKKGFFEGLGDYKTRLEELKNDIESIGQALKEIFTDPEVVSAANRYVNQLAYTLGQITGSITSIGLTIAQNLIGGMEKYLTQNTDRIKQYIISMFDIKTETAAIIGNFYVAFADIFSVFGGDTAQQITGNLIGIFAEVGMLISENAAKLGRDILNMITQPIIDNKDKIKEALERTLQAIEPFTSGLLTAIQTVRDSVSDIYDKHLKPLFDSIAKGLSDIFGKLLDGYNTYIVPVLQGLGDKFKEIMDGPFGDTIKKVKDFIDKLIDAVKLLWENVLVPFFSWIANNIMPILAPIIDFVGSTILTIFETIIKVIGDTAYSLGGLIDFIVGVFTGDWGKAWEGIKTYFEGIWKSITDVLGGASEIVNSVVEKFTEIKDKIIEKWEEVKTNTAEKWENIKSDLSEKWENLKSDASTSFENIKTDILNKWEETRTNTEKKWGEIKKDVSDKWEEIKKDSKGSAKNTKDKVVEAWEGLKSKTKEIWDGIKKCIKSPINGIIGSINKMISGIVDGINMMTRALNSISFTVPDWVPGIGGSSFGLNIPQITAPQIPKLATGTVIPPNREFLAVLGDQKHGTNIEAPLSTIEDAVENVLHRNGGTGGVKELTVHVPVEVDGRVLFDLIKKFDLEQYKSTGRPSFQI